VGMWKTGSLLLVLYCVTKLTFADSSVEERPTEALWKGKPTIAGAVGGIPNQVIDKRTGMLVHSVEGCAYQIRYLLTHPEFAAQLGSNGREHVKENFLMTTNVRRWLLLMQIMLGCATV